MNVTADARILTLGSEEKVLAAGEKLGTARHWQATGSSERALWGECLGSAVYQVTIDREDSGYRCSCPSLKFPCKHVVGLMALQVREPGSLPPGEPPEWVVTWLEKRAAKAETTAAAPSTTSAPSAATKQKRSNARMQRVLDGVAGLELWLADIERDGLARIQTQPYTFWERQAARLVDAQASGLAARVRALGAVPSFLPDWPERVLAGLGRLALLVHAFRRLDQLDPPLQHDVRRLVGWSLSSDEVTELGEAVRDHWLIAGQVVEKDDRLTTQRTWLMGMETGRTALVLQFAPGSTPSFPVVGTVGDAQEMELRFWPSALPQRARIEQRWSSPQRRTATRGYDSIQRFLDATAASIARLPWLDRSLCIVRGITIARGGENEWYARDDAGNGLPLVPREYWDLLAMTGSRPGALSGEWDGERLRPMNWFVDAPEGAV